jgi:predicted phosphodiesterase
MKVSLISDLHLDASGYLDLPGGDVLIIAGDACESRSIRNDFHSTKSLTDEPIRDYPCSEFFKHECPKYNKVFYIMGNHEHYHGKLWKTQEELKQYMPDNVTIMENQYEEYQGVIFVGATLWTDMNKHDPITLQMIKDYMMDYKLITHHVPRLSTYRKLRPHDTVEMHTESKRYIQKVVSEHADKPVVVMTHMAPTFMSVNEKYKNEGHSNGAYVSDLSDLILDHPNIKFWVHGHVHDPVSYQVGDTWVHCNPRGYLPYEAENGFDPAFSFEV